MPVTLTIKTANGEVRQARETTAHRVLERFAPPKNRVLCFLDDEDWHALKLQYGVSNRGFCTRVKTGDDHWQIAPFYLAEAVLIDGTLAFDDLIYLHGSTCAHPIGLTMTLAHELQHLQQREEHPTMWAASSLVPKLPKNVISELGLQWSDVPHEREARIIAKQTAEHFFDATHLRQYIDDKIAEHVTPTDAADWTFIRDLDTTTPFDIETATRALLPRLARYRDELEQARQALQQHDPEYGEVDLDRLLNAS